MKRNIDDVFLTWKNEKNRKVLLLRGARQVGKSSSVRNLAKHFDHFLEVNFEKDIKIHTLFNGDLNVKNICENLSVLLKVPIIPGKTLVFFDEIQSCPNAISSLRFFYEDYPELHLVAAGSLLELALETLPSFGVGRIRSVFIYPLSYMEYLYACGESALWDKVREASPEKPLFEPFHLKCLEFLRKFLITGGMPAVVADYAENRQLYDSQIILDDLVNTFKTDFSKYKKRVPDLRISNAFDAVVSQSGTRFNYSKVEPLNNKQVKESIELLQKAGLVIPVIHSASNALPLGGEINSKKQKFILLDTGIFQRLQGLELSDILLGDNISFVNKGAIAEQFAGLELLKSSSCYSRASLYFWSREKPQSNAEIDYIVQRSSNIIPIEVKSGSSGKMQSMYTFLTEKKLEYGIRTSLENFSVYDKIKVYPLYAIGTL
ncbi:MAG: AAA family ATPase [Treponema sp.]|nr:AAA family ATPase [Treponema sp.]